VLKFIGDGLLAIFPLAKRRRRGEVCRRALACAPRGQRLIEALERRRATARTRSASASRSTSARCMYGNIGGGNRLDFTCIGPAVNLAARLEKVAAQLGQTIVASADSPPTCRAISRSSANAPWRASRRRKRCSA
jgi:adenylate cyclase